MKAKSIDKIIEDLKNKSKEVKCENVIYGDDFEYWLKEQKHSNIYGLDTEKVTDKEVCD